MSLLSHTLNFTQTIKLTAKAREDGGRWGVNLRSSNLQPPVCQMQAACSHNRTRIVGFKQRKQFHLTMLIKKKDITSKSMSTQSHKSNSYALPKLVDQVQ